jgi:adenine-specific DNA-methyltransferase
MSHKPSDLLARLNTLKAPELRRLLVERLTQQKLGLYWEADALERDQALNANLVFPRLIPELCQNSAAPVGILRKLGSLTESDQATLHRILQQIIEQEAQA